LPLAANNPIGGLEISPEDADKLIEKIALRAVRSKMAVPASLLLEVCTPLSVLAGHALMLASPLLYPFFGVAGVDQYAGLLNNRIYVKRLVARIEELSQQENP